MENVKRLVVIYSPNSSRAKDFRRLHSNLLEIIKHRGWQIKLIELVDVPYRQAVKTITRQLKDGDLVLAAGGDGISQVAFNAVFTSQAEVFLAVAPLGNNNDIGRAFNGRHRSIFNILDQPAIDYFPMLVATDKREAFAIASYITFGATTIVVDYLNSDKGRKLRRCLKSIIPTAILSINQLKTISKEIDKLDFPDFYRNGQLMTEDSIGFFIIPAAHNILRLPKDVRKAASEFFFHYAKTKDKNLGGKVTMSLKWLAKFPGEMTELEEIKFENNKADIVANISGDNVNLGAINKINVVRSPRPVKVLFNSN